MHRRSGCAENRKHEMIKHLELTPAKTYVSRDNAIKAVEKTFGPRVTAENGERLDFVIVANAEGRFFPMFLGERALQAGMHFHFCVAN
jgi:hypothetical protein